MGNQGRLTVEDLKALNDELAALTKQQHDARVLAVYVRMTPQEIKDFETRKARISRIQVILTNHDSKR